MKNTLPALISIIIALVFIPSPAKATTNAANFGGGTGSAVLGGGVGTNSGVAIGTGYASTYLAPTNGLIVQGNVGIGTTAAVTIGTATSAVSIYSTSPDASPVLMIGDGTVVASFQAYNYFTGTLAGGGITGLFARGSYATPSAVQVGDRLGFITMTGYTGSAFTPLPVAAVEALVDAGTVSSTSLPTLLRFATTPNGSITRAERMRIDENGNVGVGTTSPQSLFQAYNGEVQVGSSGAACSSTNAGAFRYSGGTAYVCDSTNWNAIGGSGTLPALTNGNFWLGNASNVATATAFALTSDVTTSTGSLVTTVAKIQGTTVSGTTGSGNVVFSASPTLTGTVSGANSNWSGNVGIGTATPQGLFTVYGASTIASSASAKLDYIALPAATTTITGTTGITTAKGFNAASLYKPTYTDSSAVTIANAATLYVDNAPAAAGSVTITNPWAISVGAGNVSFPGTGNVLGTINSGTWNGSPINLSSYASGTLQAAQEPAHTGDVTNTAGSLATTVAKIQGTTVSGTTGSGNVVFSASPTLTGTVTGASSNWSGNVNIGTTAPLNGATLTLGTQTATALMVNGSGSLAIGTSLFEGAGGVNLGSGGGYYINAANIGCGFCTQNVVTIVPGTVYHNTTGKTMFVSAVVNTTVLQQIYAYSDNKSTPTTLLSQYSVNSNGYTTLTFMVMNGNSYEVTGDNTADMSIIGTADY